MGRYKVKQVFEKTSLVLTDKSSLVKKYFILVFYKYQHQIVKLELFDSIDEFSIKAQRQANLAVMTLITTQYFGHTTKLQK